MVIGFLIFVNVKSSIAPAVNALPPERVIVTTCPDTAADNVPPRSLVEAAAGVPVKSYPLGNVITILPSAAILDAVVKANVTVLVAPAAVSAGVIVTDDIAPPVTAIPVIDASVSTVPSLASVVVIVNVPLVAMVVGFLIFVNVKSSIAPAVNALPPERVIVTTCPDTAADNVPPRSLVEAAAGVPVKSYPLGNVITILPSAAILDAVVKANVTVLVAPAAVSAGVIVTDDIAPPVT